MIFRVYEKGEIANKIDHMHGTNTELLLSLTQETQPPTRITSPTKTEHGNWTVELRHYA